MQKFLKRKREGKEKSITTCLFSEYEERLGFETSLKKEMAKKKIKRNRVFFFWRVKKEKKMERELIFFFWVG
jgi:hypothetical protein